MKIQKLLLDTGIGIPLADPSKNNKENRKVPLMYLLLMSLLLVWSTAPSLLQWFDATAGSVDQSVWLLVVLGLITFLIIINLSWWLFKYSWQLVGLPPIHSIVSLYNLLSPWQQLSFLLGSFALVLLAALGSLNAVL